jgi:hypothetical protein
VAAPPRHLNLIVRNCDDCPLCVYDHLSLEDAGWNCQHPQGSFRIVDEGGSDMMQYNGVCGRIGKAFPDRCPLQTKPVARPPVYRERSIELEALGGQEESS